MTPNPVNKFLDRNYQCHLYEQCQKHAFKKNWNFWSCSECDYKLSGTAVALVRREAKSNSSPKYGKFQLILKRRVRYFSPPSKKNHATNEHTKNRTNPSPFRFNLP